MKKLFSQLLAGSLFLFGGACKKTENNAPSVGGSRTEMLLGKWKYLATGSDLNGNDSLEVSEWDAVPAGLVNSPTFASDGSGAVTLTSFGQTVLVDSIRWLFTNGDQNLLFIYKTGDTLNHFINTFTPNRIEGFNRFSSGTQYFILGK